MKKAIISAVLSLSMILCAGSVLATQTAQAQNISLAQLVQLLISLGIIPADKAAAALSIVNENQATTTSSSSGLTLQIDSATPLASTVVATQGSNSNELDGQTAIVFDLYDAQSDVQVNNISGTSITSGAGTAKPTTAYLYTGSQQISSAAIYSNGSFTFNNINHSIPGGVTQPFTVKIDIKNANSLSNIITTSIVSAVAVDSSGSPITVSGSATGNPLAISTAAPIFTIVSTPSITTQQTMSEYGYSTTTILSVFNVQIQAVGADIYFGNQS